MKILVVLPYVPSLIRVRPYHLIRELTARHEITVIAGASKRELRDAETLRDLGIRVDVIPLRLAEAIGNCGRALVTGESLQGAFCRSRRTTTQLARLLEDYQPDVVHLEHFRAAYLRAAIPAGVPTLFDSVDCISLLQERTSRSSHSFRQRLLARFEAERTRRYEAKILTQFDQVIVTSSEDRQALAELAPSAAIAVIPNGVDLDYFRPIDCARRSATLVFSGKMSYHANVTAILHFVQQIFPLVRQQHPDIRLIVAGSSPPPAVRALAQDPAIEVTGHLPDLRGTLASATVSICPVTVKVGIQNKILEAMAMGTPVVASREGATGLEAMPERDFLVADGADSFAYQIHRLLIDKALCHQVGQAGRAYVELNHRWSVAASHLEDLYRTLAEKNGRANSTRC